MSGLVGSIVHHGTGAFVWGSVVASMDGNPERETRDIHSIDKFCGSSAHKKSTPSDTILSAITDEHRRALLKELDTAPDNTLDFDALVDRVADRIRDEDVDGVSDEHRQRVRIALHHTHLPKLAEARIIDYEADTGHVQFVGGALEQEILTLVEPYDSHE